MNNLDFSTFSQVEMHVGTITHAEPFPEARQPSIKVWIDFGPLGQRKSSAHITDYYTPETLIGTQVIAVLSFPAKQIGKFMSECLVLGAIDAEDKVVLLRPDKPVENGLRIW